MSALLLLAACGPDLAELEERQRALAAEVDALSKSVEATRTRMRQMGLAPPPGPSDRAPARAEHDLAAEIPVEAHREGEAPAFAPLPAPERRESTTCGWRIAVPWLEPLSDASLDHAGGGRASPIRLLQDGRPLDPHAAPAAFEKGCRFAFRHAPRFLFLSPDRAVDAVGGAWTLALAPEVAVPRGGDGRPMYWVYPGTTLTFALGAGWDEAKWGPLAVELDARVEYVGTPELPGPAPGAPVSVSFLGHEQTGRERDFGLRHAPEPPDGPWTIRIASPPDGPYVLLRALTVGNEDYGLTLTGAGG